MGDNEKAATLDEGAEPKPVPAQTSEEDKVQEGPVELEVASTAMEEAVPVETPMEVDLEKPQDVPATPWGGLTPHPDLFQGKTPAKHDKVPQESDAMRDICKPQMGSGEETADDKDVEDDKKLMGETGKGEGKSDVKIWTSSKAMESSQSEFNLLSTSEDKAGDEEKYFGEEFIEKMTAPGEKKIFVSKFIEKIYDGPASSDETEESGDDSEDSSSSEIDQKRKKYLASSSSSASDIVEKKKPKKN